MPDISSFYTTCPSCGPFCKVQANNAHRTSKRVVCYSFLYYQRICESKRKQPKLDTMRGTRLVFWQSMHVKTLSKRRCWSTDLWISTMPLSIYFRICQPTILSFFKSAHYQITQQYQESSTSGKTARPRRWVTHHFLRTLVREYFSTSVCCD